MTSNGDDEADRQARVEKQLHRLEQMFQMSANEILDVVLANNRTLMNLKGAIAQEHLKRQLAKLQQDGVIESFEQIDKDGKPDFVVRYGGRTWQVECKNVQQRKSKREGERITVDFWRTRNQSAKGLRFGRYYAEGEFDVLAACLFNRTGIWEFRYIDVRQLPRLTEEASRFAHIVVVDDPGLPWTSKLEGVLERLKTSNS